MGTINNLKMYFHRRSFNQLLKTRPKRLRNMVNLDSAKMIGIIFQATELAERNTVTQFARQLREQGKHVKLLGYFDNLQNDDNFTFPYFNKKQIDWAYRPQGDTVRDFLDQDYDLVITLQTRTDIISEYLAGLARAGLKVGPCTDNSQCYDLMIDTPANTRLPQFIEQLERLLKKTNVKHAAAI
ncbi:MAG TPA: hypothetical protein PKE06_17355 [Flavilitoribacter sp.]|nr:hypothetical protein [Lewinella sp.]MCB9282052.1 hypothetical protein [Lewinellaceae bacterium]HMQ62449.1 hypothetical protein [Flavilitoribacter sp.]HMQ87329.1 hypothetical protein [Flavilitoribacter sp.]